MVHSIVDQKAWLLAAKNKLSKTRKNLTWDQFAELVDVPHRTFKTYRMPGDSINFRKIPEELKDQIDELINKEQIVRDSSPKANIRVINTPIIPALAALVIRQANVALVQNRTIVGVSYRPGSQAGLKEEDRKIMALVSANCLSNGIPDSGSEIHHLLERCTQPLGEWLPIPEVIDRGLEQSALIHPEDLVPTADAEELAKGFDGITETLENQLFDNLKSTLSRFPEARANQYYTIVREFIVRHAVVSIDDFSKSLDNLPAQIWKIVQGDFYEPVPESWATSKGVPVCFGCGNAMKTGKAGLICRTLACDLSNLSHLDGYLPVSELLRVRRSIKQYWVEPGLDEIRLYDKAIQMGLEAELYPHQDRVDVSIGDSIGIDLKAYSSPETLALKFNRDGYGGLNYYPRKWIVVPDFLIAKTSMYLDRLRSSLNRMDLMCLSFSEALKALRREAKGKANA